MSSADAASRRTNERPVGVVVAIRAHSQQDHRAVLIRSSRGEERKLNEADLVYDGDEVIVSDRSASVTISIGRGSIVVCSEGGASDPCSQKIQGMGYFGIFGKFYDSVARLVAQSADRTGNAATLSSRTFDDAPSIASPKRQNIKSGSRPLWLNWQAGKPPFNIAVQKNRHTLMSVDTSERTISFSPIQFSTGEYEVVIRDNVNRSLRIILNVVPEVKAMPGFPTSPNPALAKFVSAMWLSQQNQGRFQLEAAQQLSEVEESMPIARILKTEILLDP